MHLYTTDFDKHLALLENASGDIHFFTSETNPRRFVKTVVNAAQQLQPQQKCLCIFQSKGAHAKKAHHVMRTIGESLENMGIATLVHAFVVPPGLFNMLKTATDPGLSQSDFDALLENL